MEEQSVMKNNFHTKSMRAVKLLTTIIILTFLWSCTNHNVSDKSFNPKQFKNPSSDFQVHTWWHWIDGRMTRDGITKDLESMKEQGIVQATILNIGMSSGVDIGIKKIRFNTEEWYDMFKWALKEANRLGILIGVHNCDGWSESGGPWITPEMSMKKFVFTKTQVYERQKNIKLPQPLCETDFYRDVAVVAFRNYKDQQMGIQQKLPKVNMNDTIDGVSLVDGNPQSMIEVRKGDIINLTSNASVLKTKIALLQNFKGAFYFPGPKTIEYTIKASEDGVHFRKIAEVSTNKFYRPDIIDIPAIRARYFQVVVSQIHDLRPWHHAALAEVQLLGDNEAPKYNPTVLYPLEKTASARILETDVLYERNDSIDPQHIIPENAVVDLTGKMLANGALEWTPPEGNWSIIRFGYTTTGAQNGPATLEGRGLECDKMDTAAVNLHFGNFPQKLIEQAGEFTGNTFKFLMIDSWERGFQTWTKAMPHEFEERRGYNLIKWLPVLCGETVEDTEQSEAFLYDFRKTIADLFEQYYYKHFNDLCHRNKLELHGEVIYGDTGPFPPVDVLRANNYMDMPMYEFWADKNNENMVEYVPNKKLMVNFPVYASNFYDKSIIGAEAYTGHAHYSESPADLKLFGDRAFCSGINQMILHSYVHQPSEKKPGLTLGQHGSHFNRYNPFWQYTKEWFGYQARIQYMLQKGKISADILYFLGDQLPQFFENSIIESLPEGVRSIPCNQDILRQLTVNNGKLHFSEELQFALLVLPDRQFMSFETLKQIERLVSNGAVVYGKKPKNMLSLSDIKENKEEFTAISDKIWSGYIENEGGSNKYKNGTVVWDEPVERVLSDFNIRPDFSSQMHDSINLMFIHKNTKQSDVFYVANQQDTTFNRECFFKTNYKVPEIWDPLSGEVKKVAVYEIINGGIYIPVTFKPQESLFFVFRGNKQNTHINKVEREGKQLFPAVDNRYDTNIPEFFYGSKGELNYYSMQSDKFALTSNIGEKQIINVKAPVITEIDNFKGELILSPINYGEVDSVCISRLKSFTEFTDPKIKYFSGTALYQISFDLPVSYIEQSRTLYLSLGELDATAEISLNGNLLGTAWFNNQVFPVKNLLQANNQLKITLGTTCRNRIIGDLKEYGDVKNLWTFAPVKQFLNEDSSLKPSGVLGPMRLFKFY